MALVMSAGCSWDRLCECHICRGPGAMMHQLRLNSYAGNTFNNASVAAQFIWLASHYYEGNCDKAQCRTPYNCQVCALAYDITPNVNGTSFGSAPADVQARWLQESCKFSAVCKGIDDWYRSTPGQAFGDAGQMITQYYKTNCIQ